MRESDIIKVDDLLGMPFDLKGRDGHNCYTLSMEVLKRVGVELPEVEAVEELGLRAVAINSGKEDYEELEGPEMFCIVTFMIRPPFVNHMGVVLGDCKRFIHIMRSRSVAIERLDNRFWVKKIDGFFKYVGKE